MDVVRRNIEKSAVLISRVKRRRHINLIALHTLAIIDGMVVQVGRRYIIPTLSIEESFRPKKKR